MLNYQSVKAKEFDSRFQTVRVDNIYSDDEFNCRGKFLDIECESLAKDVAEHGLFTPVLIRHKPGPNGEEFTLVSGHRRLRAYKMIHAEKIPAQIQDLSDEEARSINIRENIERKNLNLWQEARALIAYKDERRDIGYIMKQINKSENWIRTRLAVLDLPSQLQTFCSEGTLLAKDIAPLLKLSGDEQLRVAGIIRDKRLSGDQKTNVNDVYKRVGARKSVARVRHKKEIFAYMEFIRSKLVRFDSRMVKHGGNCFATRCLAWAAGAITDNDLDASFVEYMEDLDNE